MSIFVVITDLIYDSNSLPSLWAPHYFLGVALLYFYFNPSCSQKPNSVLYYSEVRPTSL